MNFHRNPTTYVSKVNVNVQDLKRSLSLYKDVLGFKVLEKKERAVKLSVDGKASLLSIEQLVDIIFKQVGMVELYHFTLFLPKHAYLAGLVYYFKEKGIQFTASDHLVSEALYIVDPDGNEIELYIDRNLSEWQWVDDGVTMAIGALDFDSLLKERVKIWTGLSAEAIMGHIHLHRPHLNESETMYTKGLGLKIVNRFDHQTLFLSGGNDHHHIGLNRWKGVGAPIPPKNNVGLELLS